MALGLSSWYSEWDNGNLAWRAGSRGAMGLFGVVICPPVSTAVNNNERLFHRLLRTFSVSRIFQVHAFWETKLINFIVCFLRAIVWLE